MPALQNDVLERAEAEVRMTSCLLTLNVFMDEQTRRIHQALQQVYQPAHLSLRAHAVQAAQSAVMAKRKNIRAKPPKLSPRCRLCGQVCSQLGGRCRACFLANYRLRETKHVAA